MLIYCVFMARLGSCAARRKAKTLSFGSLIEKYLVLI